MKLLFVIFIILLSCDSNTSYVHSKLSSSVNKIIYIYVDKEFDDIDDEQINEGIMQWNYALNDFVHLKVIDWNYDAIREKKLELPIGDGFYIVKIFSDGEIPVPATHLAFVNEIGGQIIYIVRDKIKPEIIQPLMLHEIAHLLGARHRGDLLMHKFYNEVKFKCIDEDTIRQVGKYLNLDWTMLKWCINGKYIY